MDLNVTVDINAVVEALHCLACVLSLGLALLVWSVTRDPFGERP